MTDAPPAQRYKLTIAYDGSGFHGWQKQHPPERAPLRTVQQVVEDTLIQVMRQPLELVGASRTDAGVHAEGQVAHFEAVTPIPKERLADAINSRLPDDVEVRQAEPVDSAFHAIQHARHKQYRYRVFNASRRPLGLRNAVYHCWFDLDVRRMNDAAARLVGTHDFEGFAAAGHGRQTTVRSVFACEVTRQDDFVDISVEGDGFLYNMVRIIAGTLLEVGRSRFAPERIDEVIAATDRRIAGPTLPPNGLTLMWIRYD